MIQSDWWNFFLKKADDIFQLLRWNNTKVNFDLTFNKINIYQIRTTEFARDFMHGCINFSRGLHIFGPWKRHPFPEMWMNEIVVIIYTHNGNILSEVLAILWSCNPCLNDNLFFKSRGFMFKSSANRPIVCAHFKCIIDPPRSERKGLCIVLS